MDKLGNILLGKLNLAIIDSCKNCDCTTFECKHCHINEFYRHNDDKIKMKSNLKTIRNRGLNI